MKVYGAILIAMVPFAALEERAQTSDGTGMTANPGRPTRLDRLTERTAHPARPPRT